MAEQPSRHAGLIMPSMLELLHAGAGEGGRLALWGSPLILNFSIHHNLLKSEFELGENKKLYSFD